jgi:hypothetical protein
MTEQKPDQAKPQAAKPKTGQASAALPPPTPTPTPARTTKKRDVVPILYVAGFLVLAAAIVWLWQNPPIVPPPAPPPELATLRDQVRTLQAQVTRLEQRPPPTIPAPPDLAPLAARVAALEARKPPPPVDIGPIEAAIAALQQRPVGDPALTARVDAMASRQDALVSRIETTDAALAHRQDATDARLAPIEKSTGQITALADRSARIARIQAAQAALDSGISLGALPGAPAALARYATAAPPTEASLRLSYPAAASAALAASKPSVEDKPFLDRAWARAQDLVTLRQGDHVILGDAAAGILARAKAALDAGDLAGTVAALDALSGPAAAAISGWKAQAQGLLDARKALTDMAAHA